MYSRTALGSKSRLGPQAEYNGTHIQINNVNNQNTYVAYSLNAEHT